MKMVKKCLTLVTLLGALFASSAYGQGPPLTEFVNNAPNATDTQIATGEAVQRACGKLIGLPGDPFQLTGSVLDLFLRCNEMVQTADVLNGGSATPQTRDMGLNSDELLAVMQQVAGEELFSQSTMSTRVTNAQFSNISGRLNAVRLGGASAGTGGRVAYSDPYGDSNRNSLAFNQLSLSSSTLGGGAAGDLAGSRWGWFLEGSFNTGERDQTTAENGFDFDATSATLGLDYMTNWGVIGVSAGIDNYEADFDVNPVVNGGTVDIDSTSGSLFAAFYRGNLYFDAIFSFGDLDSDTTRQAFYVPTPPPNSCLPPNPCPTQDVTLLGSTSGDYLSGGATIGYDANRGNWDITTTLSLSYRDITIDGYTETDPAGGGLTLAFDKQTVESFKSIIGISFSGAFSRSFGVLSPIFRVEYHHEFEDDLQSLMAKYSVEELLAAQGVPGSAGPGVFSLDDTVCFSCFQIFSDPIDTDFGLVGVGLAAVFSRRVQLYGVFDFLVGADNLTSSTFSVGIRGQF